MFKAEGLAHTQTHIKTRARTHTHTHTSQIPTLHSFLEPGIAEEKKEQIFWVGRGHAPTENFKKSNTLKFMMNISFVPSICIHRSTILIFTEKSILVEFFPTENFFPVIFKFHFHENPRFCDKFQALHFANMLTALLSQEFSANHCQSKEEYQLHYPQHRGTTITTQHKQSNQKAPQHYQVSAHITVLIRDLLLQEILLRTNDGAWATDAAPCYTLCCCELVVLHHVAGNQCPCPTQASCKYQPHQKGEQW